MVAQKRVKLDESSKANAPPAVPPKKTRQGATKGKTKEEGKLGRMMDMPLEVFSEIASYLSPNDLLQLARSSKALRAILMSKNSRLVWEAARVAMSIPSLDGFSEPRYADLLFSKRCHGERCESRRSTRLSFELGIQLCNVCFKIMTVDDLAMRALYRNEMVGVDSHGLFPLITGTKGSSVRYLDASIRSFVKRIKQCQSTEEKMQAIEEAKRNTERMKKAAAPVVMWYAREAKMKRDADMELRATHRASIEERLIAMGYAKEDFDTRFDKPVWKWKTLVDQPRPLTENVWKNILPQLEKTLRLRIPHARPLKRRALVRSIEVHFEDLWDERQPADQIASIHPSALYKLFPDFKEMLDDPECRKPVSFEMWDSLDEEFDETVNILVKEVEADCVTKLEAAYQLHAQATGVAIAVGPASFDEDATAEGGIPSILLRATSFFKYDGELMSYAGILKLRAETKLDGRPARWSKDKLGAEVPEGVVGIAAALLRNLSLPENASMLSMECLRKVFTCQRCLRYEPFGENFAWSGLVMHFHEETKKHENRIRKRGKLGVDVPLRNEHDPLQDNGKTIFAVNESAKQNPPLFDHGDDGTYPRLTEYSLYDWGYSSRGYSSIYRERNMTGYETDEDIPVWNKGRNYDWTCKLCAALELDDWEVCHYDAEDLGKHMKKIHGTDFDGVPLVSKSKAKQKV